MTMNRFNVKIHENPGQGLKLKDLETRMAKYLDRKKAQNPTEVDGATNYVLRNGLSVNIYSLNGNGILEMLVAGDMRTFGKSIEAVMRIYKGHIEISYLQ